MIQSIFIYSIKNEKINKQMERINILNPYIFKNQYKKKKQNNLNSF